jgi:signal peptidase II
MPKVNKPQARRYVVLFLVALLLVAADQLTKWWIRENLAIGQPLFRWSIFEIIRVPPNTGAAFGLFPSHTLVLVLVSLVGIGLILAYSFVVYRRYPFLDSWLNRVSLGFILGGTIGNLLDRCLYLLGRLDGVTDFIGIGWWPPFNLADSSVVVGVILFIISLFSLTQRRGSSAWRWTR